MILQRNRMATYINYFDYYSHFPSGIEIMVDRVIPAISQRMASAISLAIHRWLNET